jgi:hypothetical protein
MTSNRELIAQAFNELNISSSDEIFEYRNLLTKKFKKDDDFDISTFYHNVSKRFKFVFYSNGVMRTNFVYIKDLTNKQDFFNLMIVNNKKIDELKKEGKTYIIFQHNFLSSYYFLMTLSAYMIEKFKDEEDKNKTVDEFELNINELLNDDIFMNYCKKFNKDAKENYYDLLD